MGSRIRSIALAGDLFLLALFPFLGSASHENGVTIASFIRVFLPFAVTWLIVGTLTSSMAVRTIRSFRRTYQRVPVSLVASGVIAIVIRDLVFDRAFVLSFNLVAIAVTTLLISAWRLVLARVARR